MKKLIQILILMILASLVFFNCSAQAGITKKVLMAYVISSDGILKKINTETLKTVDTITIPYINRDHNILGAKINSRGDIIFIILGPYGNPLEVIDTRTLEIIGQLKNIKPIPNLHYAPEGLFIAPDGQRLFMPLASPSFPAVTTVVINANTYEVEKYITDFYPPETNLIGLLIEKLPENYNQPVKIFYSDTNQIIFQTISKSNKKSFLMSYDLKTDKFKKMLTLPIGEPCFLGPNKESLYIDRCKEEKVKMRVDYNKYEEYTAYIPIGKIDIIDINSGKLKGKIDLQSFMKDGQKFNKMALTPNEKKIFYSLYKNGKHEILVIDVEKEKVVSTLPVSERLIEIVFGYEKVINFYLILIIVGAILIIALAAFLFIRPKRKKKAATV